MRRRVREHLPKSVPRGGTDDESSHPVDGGLLGGTTIRYNEAGFASVLTLCPGATESEAAANQGIDMSALPEVMAAEEVARLTLENLPNGPVFISSDYYRATFETLLSMPRRDALMAMAGQMNH